MKNFIIGFLLCVVLFTSLSNTKENEVVKDFVIIDRVYLDGAKADIRKYLKQGYKIHSIDFHNGYYVLMVK